MSDAGDASDVGDAERTDAEAVLSVRNLRSGYGETEVLRGVSFGVGEGEVVALVGRNGVGKTTTLRTVTGAIAPRGGEVRHRGRSIGGLGPTETAKLGVGLVPEERRVFPGLTVEENLQAGATGGATGDAPERSVEEVLSTFENLADRRGNRGADLSGGEQQMLAIGRALTAGADLLLLDEPTEGLAPLVVDRVVEAVRAVNDDGVTVLLVEQNVAVALELADRVVVMDDGEVVHAATAAELRANDAVLDRHLGVTL
ncbi:ABC transporter ATP-binding protein [Halobacteriales archaeon SW_12_71_31]|nr:MAG: ABC transporter ATP-binding protein [Halobacteriales archaeon SW_12_71_31]